MLGSIYSNRIIRKIQTGFASLFTNITLVRENSLGQEQQRLIVPLEFSSREKFIKILQGDPKSTRPVQITLPQMSYIISGMKYDASRKEQSLIKNYSLSSNKTLQTQYNGVPYNFNYNLYIYTRNIEDGNQIIEQILPYFFPSYTLRINLIPNMGITKEIPIILNSIDFDDGGDSSEEDISTRTLVWNLGFTVKGWLYGAISTNGGPIKEAITNIYIKNDDPSTGGYSSPYVYFLLANNSTNGNTTFSNYKPGELAYQGNTLSYSTASGYVVSWSNTTSRLELKDISGVFTTNENVVGNESGANYTLINYLITPSPVEKITANVVPMTANIGDNYTVNITKTFYG